VYTPIGSVAPDLSGGELNLYGVVSFIKDVYRTKGSDWCCTLTLVDPSWQGTADQNNDGLKCQLFADESSLPPLGTGVGDIVRLHRVKVNTYKGELQVQKSYGFSSLTFNGRVGYSALCPFFSIRLYPPHLAC
jgi:protection-of-telomeres protein 1